jgi:transposase
MQAQNSKLDFNGQNIYVGFDVHLKSWTITILTDKIAHKTFTQPPNPDLLYNYLERNFPGGIYHSVYEAGFCGFWIHNRLKSKGVKSMIVNPADIPTTDKEKVQKEDCRDSRKLARALRSGELIPIYVPTESTIDDRGLVRSRIAMVQDLTRVKNRVKSFLHLRGIPIPSEINKTSGKWSNNYSMWLKSLPFNEPSAKAQLDSLVRYSEDTRQNILSITRQIRSLSISPRYEHQIKLLRTVPGIGLLTAMSIMTELENINRFDSQDKLCSFIGLIPSTKSSGENELTGDITRRGHSFLRSALIESAWVAARIDPAMSLSYNQYCKRMEPNKAIVRIARKLLGRIRTVLKNNTPYVLNTNEIAKPSK